MKHTTIQMFTSEMDKWKDLMEQEKSCNIKFRIVRSKIKSKIKRLVYLIRKSKNNNFKQIFHKQQTEIQFRKAS
jgi:hypothetical protein